MIRYVRQLKEDYAESKVPGEGMMWWYIRRVASDWVKMMLVGLILIFMIFTFTHPVFMVRLVEVLAVVAVLASIAEPIIYRKKRTKE